MNPERTLPHDLDAERAVLGAILLHQALMHEAEGVVTAAEFYRPQNALIFASMAKLSSQKSAIDFLTLQDALGSQIDEAGGPAYLAALIDGVPRTSSLVAYARIVREKANLRNLIFAANRIISRAYEASDDAAEILTGAEKDIIGLGDKTIADGFEAMGMIAGRGLDFLEQASKRTSSLSGVPSGLRELDAITRGFQPGTLVTVGARPGVGKSSLLANNIAQCAALAGHKVALFSLEMGKVELFIRQISARAHIDSTRLNTGKLSDHDWRRVTTAIGELSEASFYIDDTSALSLMEVRSRARRLKAEHGLDVLLIDYLQLMSTPNVKGSNRAIEIGAITSALKALAKELQIPVIIASQLNREMISGNRAPRLSDLRESGSIEQDSDMVLLLHRDDEHPELPTELIVAKHRGGATGQVKVAWVDTETRFDNLATGLEPRDRRLPRND